MDIKIVFYLVAEACFLCLCSVAAIVELFQITFELVLGDQLGTYIPGTIQKHFCRFCAISIGAQELEFWLCVQITCGRHRRPYNMPGIKPRLAVYKANAVLPCCAVSTAHRTNFYLVNHFTEFLNLRDFITLHFSSPVIVVRNFTLPSCSFSHGHNYL